MNQIAQYLIKQSKITPSIGIVLGSGLDRFCDKLDSSATIQYNQIPNFRKTSVKGHKGEFVLGSLYGQNIICANGRFHYYEGYEYDEVAIIIDIFKELGCKLVIMTNSSGCVIKEWDVGDLMLITGHIDYSFRDSNKDPKVIQDSRYNQNLIEQIDKIAEKNQITLRHGVYTWTMGPTYETPAEIADIEKLGGHAVCMSGLPEIERIHELNMKMIGLCCLTNYASGIKSDLLTHKEVVETAQRNQTHFIKLLDLIVQDKLLD